MDRALRRGRLAFGPLGAFLLHGLIEGHPHQVDETLAQRTLLYSRRSRSWSPALLQAFGLPAEPLPAPVPADHEFGRLIDADHPLPLRLAIGDQNVVPAIGSAGDPDGVFINLGTGAFILKPLKSGGPLPDPDPFQLSIIGRDGQHSRYALEGSVHGAGSALNRLHARDDPAGRGRAVEEALAEENAPGLFLNTVDGLGSPWWRSGGPPRFVPAEELSKRQCLAAVLESIVFLLRVNLERLAATQGPVREVLTAGGLSRSDGLCQRMADGLGCRIRRLRGAEATTTGLWRRLSGPAAPGPCFQPFEPRPNPDLEARYLDWGRHMPAVLEIVVD